MERSVLGGNCLMVQRIQLLSRHGYAGWEMGGRRRRRRRRNRSESGSRGKNDRDNCGQRVEFMRQIVGLVTYWRLIVKKRGSTQNGRTQCCHGTLGCLRRREAEKSIRMLVDRMMSAAEGGTGSLHRNTKPGGRRRGLIAGRAGG